MTLRNPLAFLLPLLLGAAMLLTSGCGGSNTDAKYLVIFCQANNGEPYRAAQNKRFEELFGERDDVELIIYDAQGEAAKQIEQVEQAVNQQPDLLIVAPLNRTALNAPMKKSMDANIHTICLERDISGNHQTTFIGCDNVAIGRMAGEYIVEALTEKHGEPRGRLIELTGSQGVQAANDRHNGAFEVLQPYIDSGAIEVIHTATGNWSKDEAIARMEEAYTAAEGEFDVVYGHNDPMAYGAYLVAKEKDPAVADAALFVGVDGLPTEGELWVQSGELDATFEYPLCADKAFEIGMQMLEDPVFTPEATYILSSRAILDE